MQDVFGSGRMFFSSRREGDTNSRLTVLVSRHVVYDTDRLSLCVYMSYKNCADTVFFVTETYISLTIGHGNTKSHTPPAGHHTRSRAHIRTVQGDVTRDWNGHFYEDGKLINYLLSYDTKLGRKIDNDRLTCIIIYKWLLFCSRRNNVYLFIYLLLY